MKGHFFVLACLVLGAITGCGPEKSELDLERERANERLTQKTTEADAIVGTYEGWALFEGKRIYKAFVLIDRSFSATPGQSGADPTLNPRITVGLLFETGGPNNDFVFPSVQYYAPTKTLIANLNVGQVGASDASLVLDFSTPTITGRYFAPRFLPLPNGKKTYSFDIALEKTSL